MLTAGHEKAISKYVLSTDKKQNTAHNLIANMKETFDSNIYVHGDFADNTCYKLILT